MRNPLKLGLHLLELSDRGVQDRGGRNGNHDTGTSWFLAQLKPNCAASRSATSRGRASGPSCRSKRPNAAAGQVRHAERPLFPGYIFVAFDVQTRPLAAVNSTYGITRLVSLGKEPAAVPLDLISQIMLRCDASGKLLPPKVLKPGDQVALTKGPVRKFRGRGREDRAGSPRLGPDGDHGRAKTGGGRGGASQDGVSAEQDRGRSKTAAISAHPQQDYQDKPSA